MSLHKEPHLEHKLRKNIAEHTGNFPEIQDIKDNILGLAHKLQETSTEAAEQAIQYAHDQTKHLKSTGLKTLQEIEKQVKSNPYQSTFLAFMAGAALSYFFSRKS